MSTRLLLPPLFCLIAAGALAQGPLAPLTGPTPTMKTLDQIEPRKEINATNTPGDADSVFRIGTAGSYYLTGNVAGASGKSAIEIASSNVTIDLNGFTLQGVTGSVHGIVSSAILDNLAIRNGSITGFPQRGINLAGSGALIEQIRVSGNVGGGILVGDGAVVRACTASGNLFGISTGTGSAVSGCTASSNTSTGIGVSVASLVTASAAYENGADGISLNTNATVSNCISSFNTGDGIQASSKSLITDNSCASNGGAGIFILFAGTSGGDNRIERNQCTGNARGIDVDGATINIIRGNTVRRNTDNYDISPGNLVEILLSEIPETIEIPAKVILAGTLTGESGQNGITVTSDNVSIDLDGHTLVGVSGSLDGILVTGAHTNVSVRNGTVRNWGGDGVDTNSTTLGAFADLQLLANGVGLRAGTQMVITKVTSRGNTGTGILTQAECKVIESICSSNGNNGISVGDSSSVERCNLFDNAGNGIVVSDSSRIIDNTCDNHNDAGMAGILVNSDRNRIEGNHLTRNVTGLSLPAAANFNIVMRNSASGNTTAHYSIVGANNDVGPTGTAATATSPWANLQN